MNAPSFVTLQSARRARQFAFFAGIAAAVMAASVFSGWILGVEWLKSLAPGLPVMKANTALCVALLAVAVCISARSEPLPAWILPFPALAGTIALLTAAQWLFSIELGLDEVMFADPSAPQRMTAGRMPLVTAIALTSLAIATVRTGFMAPPALARQCAALLPFSFGLLALIGHAFDARQLPVEAYPFAAMSIPTAICLTLLGLGILAAEPRVGIARILLDERAGGRFGRQVLPIAILFPIVVGWLRFAGERSGYFDSRFGVLIMVLSALTVFSIISIVSARWLNKSQGALLEAQHLLERRVQERTTEMESNVVRLRAEMALREAAEVASVESRALFQNALEFAPIGMAVVGLDGRWLRVNRALCRIVDYTEQELLALTFQDITHPDDLDADLAQVRNLMDGIIPSYQIEKRYLRRDGKMVWVMLQVSMIRDGEGKPLYFIAQIDDIGERRKALQDLEGSRKLLTEVISAIPVPFALKDEHTRWLIVNDAMGRYNGRPTAELIGRTDVELFGPDIAATYHEEDALALESDEPFLIEGMNVSVSGQQRWVLKHKRGIHLPDGTRMIAVTVTDISGQKEIAERLRKSEERFRSLTQLSADWFWEQDEAHRFTDLSGNVLDPTGMHAEEFIGKTRWELSYDNMTAEDWSRHRGVLDARQPYRDLTLTRTDAKGQRHYIAVSGEPTFDDKGRFRGYRGIGRDITARRRAETELANSRQFLSDVIDAIPIPLTVKDEERRLIIVNDANRVFHGRPLTELRGKLDTEIYESDRAAQFRAEDDAVLDRGEQLIEEQAFSTLSGEKRWVIKQKRRIKLSDGRGGVITTLLDITNRKQAEAALAESEAWLRLVTENSAACIGYIDRDERFRFCNSTYQKWYGMPLEAMLGKSVRELVGEQEYPRIQPAYRKAMKGQRADYERALVRDGVARSIYVDLIPDVREEGVVLGVFIYSVDITSRVEGERALHESEERFQIVSRGTDDGIWDWNLLTGTCYFSPRYKSMLGFSDDEFPPGREAFERCLHPDDKPRTLAALEMHFERRDPYEVEYRLRNKAGDYRWFQARGQATWNDAGLPVRFSGALRDITQRKQFELELERNRLFLDAVIEAIPQPVYLKDAGHRWVLFNSAFCEMLERDRAELIGRSDADVFPAQVAAEYWKEDDEVLSGAGALIREGPMTRRDGSIHWQLRSKRRVNLPDGSIGIVGVAADVTSLKETQEALRTSETLHRLLSDNSIDMISLLTPEGVMDYASPASAPLLGYSPGEIVGMSILEFVHPDDLPRIREILAGIEQHTSSVLTCRLRRAAGGWMWIETSFRAAQREGADRALQIIAVSRDVDDRVRVGEALNRFKYVLDHTLDMIFIYDVETLHFNYVNDGAAKTLGYSKERLLGMAPWELRGDITVTEYYKSIEPFLRGDIQSRQVETVHRHADGHLVPVDVTMQLVRRPGEAGTFISVARDATERKKVERMKNEFVSTVSHELRTPVTSIRGSLGLLLGGVAGKVEGEARQLIEIANSNSERLIRLINDILDIEKIESGKMRFTLKPVALRTLMDAVLAENRGYGEQFGVRYVVSGELPDISLRVDPDRIMQVMANLLSNAAKFSPRDAEVGISAVTASGSVRISVSDRGAGIPAEFHGRIFGKFSQADASDSRRMGGTGLGLSIAKAIVEKHSGTIGFKTGSGGTTFFFDLPLAFSGQSAESDASAPALH